jgi:predicted metal-dependent HD superfamily phosphohydrolase
MKGYYKLRKKIIEILDKNLSEKLYYHGIHHTLNALKTSEKYLKNENIKGEQAKLLRLGILLHDIGYIVSIKNHEDYSLKIAEELMRNYEFSKENIKIIKRLITVTKKKEFPKNILEKIISDVDLDYLGGPKFYEISMQLYHELKIFNKVNSINQWNKIQLNFLENHKYYTDYAIKYKQPEKLKRIIEIKSKITNS